MPSPSFVRLQRAGCRSAWVALLVLGACLAVPDGGLAGRQPAKKPRATNAAAPKPPPFGLAVVADKARALAKAPYKEPERPIPDWLREITYDQWRDIRFRSERALWGAGPGRFAAQFFHPGLFYDRRVRVQVVSPSGVTPVAFSPSEFDYGENDFASRTPQDLGYAGFRLHYPLKTPQYRDEVVVFLGATYFRAVGRDHVFGLSARGLAIDTAEAWGEEFPWFREFWLVEPATKATAAEVFALLDSPRVTGAYRFVVTPGEVTRIDVECQLFLRKDIHKIGIAPLTSMFFHGENTTRPFVDFRPEVHDSDGVLLHHGSGEWLWRPLDNPRSLNVSSLGAERLAGFGLVQRDRTFDHYQDLETKAERRPSAWVVPRGDWGPGRVELVEIPTTNDSNDNVVAYWVPTTVPKAGDAIGFAYTVHWYGDNPEWPPGGRAVATRRDVGPAEGVQRIVVDFAGGTLGDIPPDEVLRAVVTVVGGEDAAAILDQHVVPNPHIKGWRLSLRVRPKRREAVELRAFLERSGAVLTETWSHAVLP